MLQTTIDNGTELLARHASAVRRARTLERWQWILTFVCLVPLIAACAIWFSQTRDSWWQWAFLGLGAVLIVIAIRLAMESFEDRRGRTGVG